MKRRYIALLIPVISLLTCCARNNVRSDILKFIASFSIESAVENYKAATYLREDISIENDVTSRVLTTMTIDRRETNNLMYDYSEITLENDEEKSSIHNYVEKRDEKYFYISEEVEEEKTYEWVDAKFNTFFYTTSREGIYLGGMFMGDSFREIIPEIQDLVKIDSENKLVVYSYVNLMTDQNKEVRIEQTVTLDQYGMLVKEDMKKTSDLGVYETHIEVKKV